MGIKPPFDIKSIKPGEFAYITKRKLKNKNDEETGEIILWRRKDEEESHYIMICPYCGVEQRGEVVFKRRPYRVKCSSCKRTITLPKLLNKKVL